jgi:hypothetical protein
MNLNPRDTITRFLLSLVRTPLLYFPYYRSHLPWPAQILIENTNCCNALCVMCPRDTLTRKHGFMEFALFEKIMAELSGARRKPVVHLHGFGEPLLDLLLPERIKLAKACGIKQTYIVTNASLLFPETARSLILAGLDTMKISFYGTDEASYNNTMRQLDFKVSLKNIKDFMQIRNELKRSNPKLILQYLPQQANGAQRAEFQSLWRSLSNKIASDCLNISSLDNFGGGKSYNQVGERIMSVCFYPWSAMSVLWDGRAVTCCVDYNGMQGIGDLNVQSIREIWNGPELSTIRKNFGRLDYSGFPTCLRCDWVHRR